MSEPADLSDPPAPPAAPADPKSPRQWRGRLRVAASWTITALAFVLVWFALVGPDQLQHLTLGAFLRIPIEGLVLVALALVLPPRARLIVGLVVGVVLALVSIAKLLDMGFFAEVDRPFNPVSDWTLLGPAVGVYQDSVGHDRAVAAVVGAILLAVVLLVFLPLSVVRLTRLTSRRRVSSARVVGVLGVVWILCAVFGVQIGADGPVASTSASGLAYQQVHAITSTIQDQHGFATALTSGDHYSITPGSDLLTALRGKDVLFVFVESYGQVAVQGTNFSSSVDTVLNAGTKSLDAAGYSSQSAWLTSPTFGGISWLAHSTFQSGLWVDSQQRYNQLVASKRFTLSDAFNRAGWRTVGDVPSNHGPWPQGTSFYHYDQIYNAQNVGYKGPRFSYETMPDQYILSAFQQRELAKPGHRPVMAEIDLVSSHTPWAPLPHAIPWNAVGDGSIYDPMPAEGQSPSVVWQHASQVQAAYGQSIQYSVSTLVSFVQQLHDKNLVMVMMGDHQPATIVSGTGANHNVPITIIAHDPKVMEQISSWGWQDGMLPGKQAPNWTMDAFRNKFLGAFSGKPPASH